MTVSYFKMGESMEYFTFILTNVNICFFILKRLKKGFYNKKTVERGISTVFREA
jgi:hypothetical protein